MRSVCLSIGFAVFVPGVALAAPAFHGSIGQPGDAFAIASSDVLEARFRADTTNWDLRLENSGSPSAGGNQSNLADGSGAFNNRTFDFVLSYSAALDQVSWSVSRGSGLSGLLVYDASAIDSFNTIHFATGAGRATVSVDNLIFSGLGMTESAWPDLSASSAGTSFRQTNLILGEDANLLASDWSLSGRVHFADFTHNNPSDGAGISVRLYQAAEIPSPGGIASLGLAAGFCLARRRRA